MLIYFLPITINFIYFLWWEYWRSNKNFYATFVKSDNHWFALVESNRWHEYRKALCFRTLCSDRAVRKKICNGRASIFHCIGVNLRKTTFREKAVRNLSGGLLHGFGSWNYISTLPFNFNCWAFSHTQKLPQEFKAFLIQWLCQNVCSLFLSPAMF